MRRTAIVLISIVAVLIAAFVVTAPLHVGYYAEYNGLLREIRKHPGLEVIDGWRNEDLSLEEFGFSIRSPRATLAIYLSEKGVRRPGDRADGIAMPTGSRLRDGNTSRPVNAFIRFDSADWNQRGLPAVRTLGDVIAHFDVIAHSLLTDPPTTIGVSEPGNYISLSPRVGKTGNPRPEPLSADFWDRWQRILR